MQLLSPIRPWPLTPTMLATGAKKRRLGPPLGPGTTREDLQEHICHRVLTCSSQITARLKRNANSSEEERGFSSATTGYAKTRRERRLEIK